tara:strand:- start:163 stop:363 length:201 start_codon:yes stop_codon:yes gene_type:complete
MNIQKLKRKILQITYRMLMVKIDFQNKCDHCFEEKEWQGKDGSSLCEKHYKETLGRLGKRGGNNAT